MLISGFFFSSDKRIWLTVSKCCRMQKTTGKHVPKKQVLIGNVLCWEGVNIWLLVPLRCVGGGFGCRLTCCVPSQTRVVTWWWHCSPWAARGTSAACSWPAAGTRCPSPSRACSRASTKVGAGELLGGHLGSSVCGLIWALLSSWIPFAVCPTQLGNLRESGKIPYNSTSGFLNVGYLTLCQPKGYCSPGV